MPKLHYLIGDATEPISKPAMICHINNDIGGWGRGFVLSLSAKYPKAETAYKNWKRASDALVPGIEPFALGNLQFLRVTADIHIANMIAQHGIRWQGKIPPIRYDALEKCLDKVYECAQRMKLSVHMPRIGAVLAGGEWPKIEKIIKSSMTVETYVYTLKSQKNRWPTDYESV